MPMLKKAKKKDKKKDDKKKSKAKSNWLKAEDPLKRVKHKKYCNMDDFEPIFFNLREQP
ncbi:hypothetical protein GR11A_00199 [Vibrio phage vB_VcorM_GR11A]|nr:hypothetical protein GR11A_00199 [Vibrio phage vB_VcorM_GR11A]